MGRWPAKGRKGRGRGSSSSSSACAPEDEASASPSPRAGSAAAAEEGSAGEGIPPLVLTKLGLLGGGIGNNGLLGAWMIVPSSSVWLESTVEAELVENLGALALEVVVGPMKGMPSSMDIESVPPDLEETNDCLGLSPSPPPLMVDPLSLLLSLLSVHPLSPVNLLLLLPVSPSPSSSPETAERKEYASLLLALEGTSKLPLVAKLLGCRGSISILTDSPDPRREEEAREEVVHREEGEELE